MNEYVPGILLTLSEMLTDMSAKIRSYNAFCVTDESWYGHALVAARHSYRVAVHSANDPKASPADKSQDLLTFIMDVKVALDRGAEVYGNLTYAAGSTDGLIEAEEALASRLGDADHPA